MNEGFKTADAERLAGLPWASLSRMQRRDFPGPELPGKRWSRRQIVAIKTMRGVRRQGACLTASVAAYDLLCRKSAEDLAEDFNAGRRYLVLLGESMILRLVDREKAFDPILRERAIRESLPLIIADVSIISGSIDAAIQNLERGQKNVWEAASVSQRGRQPAL